MSRRERSELSPSMIQVPHRMVSRARTRRRRWWLGAFLVGVVLVAALASGRLFAATTPMPGVNAVAVTLVLQAGTQTVNCLTDKAGFRLQGGMRFTFHCNESTATFGCALQQNASYQPSTGALSVRCGGYTEVPRDAPPSELLFASGAESP